MLPNRLIVRSFLVRGAWLWLGARLLITAVFLLAGVNPVRLSAASVSEIVLVTVALSFLETHLRREHTLLANLSVGPLALTVLFAGPALAGELALRLAAAAVR